MQLCADLPTVHFLPLQPGERLCELLNMANLHLLPQSRAAADLVLPSKLGGMLASGKPVLAAADAGTELFEVLSGTTILVPAGDSVAMAREIGILVAEGKHPALGDGRKLAQSFDREACLAKFCALLDGTTEQDAAIGAEAA
jgi:colanic acid biosynthesis glycosyl transferase WcaI